ncbi:hypothetical protein GCM10011313_09740 [Mycetocola zhadangensis]|nr:hypothetical protein GCM10011313_09740 [Mycetocola zhadangensis]
MNPILLKRAFVTGDPARRVVIPVMCAAALLAVQNPLTPAVPPRTLYASLSPLRSTRSGWTTRA